MKSKHYLVFVFLVGLFSTHLTAQPFQKVKVKVTPFEYTQRTANRAYVEMIRDHITIKLNNIPGVEIIASDDREKIYEEQDILKTEPFIESEHVDQGRLEGAEKLLVAKVYLTEVKYNSTGGYTVAFSIYLAAVDVEKGLTEDNIMLSPNGRTDYEQNMQMIKAMKVASSLKIINNAKIISRGLRLAEKMNLALSYTCNAPDPTSAFTKTLSVMDKDLLPFLNYYFGDQTGGYIPQKSKTAEVMSAKGASNGNRVDPNDKGVLPYWDESLDDKHLLFDMSTGSMKKGTKLTVYKQIKMPNGKIREVEKGEIVIEKVEGDYAKGKIKTRKVKVVDIYQVDGIIYRISGSKGIKNPFKK